MNPNRPPIAITCSFIVVSLLAQPALANETVFGDGFESGDTLYWTLTSP